MTREKVKNLYYVIRALGTSRYGEQYRKSLDDAIKASLKGAKVPSHVMAYGVLLFEARALCGWQGAERLIQNA